MRGPVDRWFAHAASRVLRAHGVPGGHDLVAAGRSLASELPRPGRSSPGVRITLGLFRRCLGLHRAMLAAGTDRDTADRVVEDLMWSLVAPVVRLSYATTRPVSADRTRRAALANRMAWTVAFRAPFVHESRPDRGPVAFDVHVCPFAEYFAGVGEPGFTAVVACSLDHRMATLWRHELVRPTTIAAGDDRCSFTFTPVELTRR